MQKNIRWVHRLLPVLAGTALIACNSSGSPPTGEIAEDRPTIVSSDAAITREVSDPVSDSNASAADVSDPDAPGTETPDVVVPVTDGSGDDAADPNPPDTGNTDTGNDIRTIEDLLAHLEAGKRARESSAAEVSAGHSSAAATVDDAPSEQTAALANTAGPTDASVNDDVQQQSSNTETTDPEVDAEVPQPPADIATDDSTDGSTDGSTDSTAAPSLEAPENAAGDNDETTGDAGSADAPAIDTSMPVHRESDEQTTEIPTSDSPDRVDQDTEAAVVDVPDQGDSDLFQDDDTASPANGFASAKSEIMVDCKLSLPCTANHDDVAVTVVIENVYRNPETQRLAIAMSVTANRDTALKWDSDVTSTDDVATTYNGISRDFSGFYQFDKDNDMVTLLAGTTLLVVQHFREMPSDTTVSMVRYDTGYIEAGVRTVLQFSNMPLDPVLGDIVDCADQVPCSWVANDQSYSVNVLKVSGLWQTGRLRIDIEVRAVVGMGISVFSADPVVGNDGSVFTPRTHSLGGTSDYRDFTVHLVPEGILSGHQDFLKNANRLATSLKQVKLGMTRVDAPGAGSPVFRNLPLE